MYQEDSVTVIHCAIYIMTAAMMLLEQQVLLFFVFFWYVIFVGMGENMFWLVLHKYCNSQRQLISCISEQQSLYL